MQRQYLNLLRPTVHGDGTITVTVTVWEMHRRDTSYPTRYYAFVAAHQQGRDRRGRFGRRATAVHDLIDTRDHVVKADTLKAVVAALRREVEAVVAAIECQYITPRDDGPAGDDPPVNC